MSHIQVPPLKRPRSDYPPFWLAQPTHSSTTTIVCKRRVAATNPLQDALQASMQYNADLGVYPGSSLDKQKRKLMKQRRAGQAAAGPSSSSVSSHPPKTKKLKRPFMDDDDDEWDPSPRYKKRPWIP
jgi:hypothetical protein